MYLHKISLIVWSTLVDDMSYSKFLREKRKYAVVGQ